MRAAGEEFAHLFVHRRGVWDEPRLHRHIHHVEAGEAFVGLARQAVDLPQKVFGVDHTDDVLRLIFPDRDARVGGVEAVADDFLRVGVGVDGLDIPTVHHHLRHLARSKVERREDAVTVVFLNRAFGMVQIHGGADFFMRAHDPGIRVGDDAEDAQCASRQHAHERHHRRQHPNNKGDRTRHADRGGLR